jgi:Na+-driven multidrug efflux pump
VGTYIAVGVSATITVIILLFGNILMYAFTDTAELVDLSMRMMRILAVGYIAMAVTQCLSGVMRGAGDTMSPMWISILTTVVIRVPLAYAIAYFTRTPQMPTGNYRALFISLLVSWVLGAVITFIAYRRRKWKNRAMIYNGIKK